MDIHCLHYLVDFRIGLNVIRLDSRTADFNRVAAGIEIVGKLHRGIQSIDRDRCQKRLGRHGNHARERCVINSLELVRLTQRRMGSVGAGQGLAHFDRNSGHRRGHGINFGPAVEHFLDGARRIRLRLFIGALHRLIHFRTKTDNHGLILGIAAT